MTTGIVVLNFGEPPTPDRSAVIAYLERIFLANAPLDGASGDAAQERARQLAERRAPDLIEEYDEINGSPLNDQAQAQAAAIEKALQDRGYDVSTYVGMQFMEPFISDAVASAQADGVDQLIGLPIYPLCGPSTTVQSLAEMEQARADMDWDVPVRELTGWHKHPTYNRLRAENILEYVRDHALDLHSDDTQLVFSAHGTPEHYLEEGSRYQQYVEEYCAAMAGLLNIESYALGYQNHENRDIPWTSPDIEDLIPTLDTTRIVVEPVSFMHEQSETLSELDIELRETAEANGLEFHRVPIPHDDARFPSLLADLVEPLVADIDPTYYNLQPCLCRETPGTYCLNAGPNQLTTDAPSVERTTPE